MNKYMIYLNTKRCIGCHGCEVHCKTNKNLPAIFLIDFTEQHFKKEVLSMFDKIDIHPSHPVVQLNITLSNYEEQKLTTLDLFSQEEDNKLLKLTASMQKLREKHGIDIIKSAGEL